MWQYGTDETYVSRLQLNNAKYCYESIINNKDHDLLDTNIYIDKI